MIYRHLGLGQQRNIKLYAAYLEERVVSFREVGFDYVGNENRSKRFQTTTWADGLKSEITLVQRQIKSLLECKFYLDSIDNEVTMEALRLLIADLLKLNQCTHEAFIAVLRRFFVLHNGLRYKKPFLYWKRKAL